MAPFKSSRLSSGLPLKNARGYGNDHEIRDEVCEEMPGQKWNSGDLAISVGEARWASTSRGAIHGTSEP